MELEAPNIAFLFPVLLLQESVCYYWRNYHNIAKGNTYGPNEMDQTAEQRCIEHEVEPEVFVQLCTCLYYSAINCKYYYLLPIS
ncbi:hypothetical protein D3C85_1522360 [compost metagenome]